MKVYEIPEVQVVVISNEIMSDTETVSGSFDD